MRPLAELRRKWTAAVLCSTLVELVEEFDDDTIERIEDWDAGAADFIADMRRLSERTDIVPSFAQVRYAARLHARFVDRDGWGDGVADELDRLVSAGDKGPPAAPRPAQIDDFDPDATTATTATHARGDAPDDDDGIAYRAPGYRPSDDDCDDGDDDEPPPPRPAPRRRWLG